MTHGRSITYTCSIAHSCSIKHLCYALCAIRVIVDRLYPIRLEAASDSVIRNLRTGAQTYPEMYSDYYITKFSGYDPTIYFATV